MSNPHIDRILKHIADRRYQPQRMRQLAQDLGVPEAGFEDFAGVLNELIGEGRVVLDADATVGLPPPGRVMIGTFRLNKRGFGFVVPESPTEHGDLFVPEGNTGSALTGDLIRATVIHVRNRAGRGRSPYIGRVTDILQRADKQYVGNLTKRGQVWVVEVDGRHLPDPIVIRDPHARDARQGDKVVIELIVYPTGSASAEGVILEVLGKQGEPDVETEAVIRAYGLRDRFEPEVIESARAAAQAFDDKSIPDDREDLTGTFICTIDPPDARDYDDAISIEKFNPPDGDAVYQLGVHIADVSTFVKLGSEMDSEAAGRGNSVYLPRRVLPMLPELLSNGVCSLQEGVNRLCKSAFIRYDGDGNVVGQRFASTVIKSCKRLTYLEAQALIDDDVRTARKHTKSTPKYGQPLIHALKLMDELARIIRARRLVKGMITLDLPSAELVFDDSGRVVDAVPEDDAYTHTIIEMFMVEANEAAARLFDGLGVAMLRRIHADPPAHDLTELRRFAHVAGHTIPQRPSRHDLQSLLDAVRGTPAQHAVHLAVLQTLSRAEYAPLLIGHFALASEHYTHFTSPIRRYVDLVVHRALDAYLEQASGRGGRGKKRITARMRDDLRVPDEQALAEIGRHCSQAERNAEAAERDLTNYLVLDLLGDHLGDDFDGTVTGITGSGVFVQLDRYLVDGFIRNEDLPGDGRWRLNRNTGALVAQDSGRSITIGDRFVVRIANVDAAARRLDLVIIEKPAGRRTPKKRKQPVGARKAHQRTTKLKTKRKQNRKCKQ